MKGFVLVCLVSLLSRFSYPSRLSENAHLRRYPHPSSLRRTNKKTVHGVRRKVNGLKLNRFEKNSHFDIDPIP
jgi:hypothetical protein